MLDRLNSHFRLLGKSAPATDVALATIRERFGVVPEQFIELAREATEIEIQHENGVYFRIWGPEDCVSMDKGYEISSQIKGSFPIGDDGGGRAILFMEGKNGFGLYLVGFGDLDANDAKWIVKNLSDLLLDAKGIEVF